MMNKGNFYFPGWTKKAISFTIDDGNVPLDRKFLNIVKPAGILGTFNLCSNPHYKLTPEEYREMYRGYEIANHCKYHPFVFDPSREYRASDEPFDANTSDRDYIYKTDMEGVYHYNYSGRYWSYIATVEAYCRLAEISKRELTEIFGDGSIKGFVYPYGYQKDPTLKGALIATGVSSIRGTGCTGFELPSDRFAWSYGANHTNLNERAREFEEIEDDGALRWFCFGVHSHDFENNDCWDVLERFADDYGNRPEDFWYATVRDIFEYEDAVNAAIITDEKIENPSEITLYLKINGKRVTLFPKETYKI